MYMFEEAIPDCVPEFYRSRQEDAEHKYELLTCCQERCRANRQKLDEAAAAGLPILSYGGYEACWECPDADRDTMTGDDDDMCRVICHNPACPHHGKGKSR